MNKGVSEIVSDCQIERERISELIKQVTKSMTEIKRSEGTTCKEVKNKTRSKRNSGTNRYEERNFQYRQSNPLNIALVFGRL